MKPLTLRKSNDDIELIAIQGQDLAFDIGVFAEPFATPPVARDITGCVPLLEIRDRSYSPAITIFVCTLTNPTGGVIGCTMAKEVLAELDYGTYFFDLRLFLNGVTICRPLEGKFTVVNGDDAQMMDMKSPIALSVPIADDNGSDSVTPLDGTGDAGESTEYSRADHKHADAYRHTHANEASLDLVAGTNTGDQNLSAYALKAALPTFAITDPQDGDTLVYDAASSSWKNVSGS